MFFLTQKSCSDKAILDGYKLIHSDSADKKLAFNEVSSCATLKLNDGYKCCYIKLKFKNELVDEKFTHEGCYEINYGDVGKHIIKGEKDFEFDDLIDDIKSEFNFAYQNSNPRLVSKKITIDCNSKYLYLSGFALLLFLLL